MMVRSDTGIFVKKQTYFLEDEQSNDQTIDTQDTSHNNWDDGFEDQLWFQDTHGGDSDS